MYNSNKKLISSNASYSEPQPFQSVNTLPSRPSYGVQPSPTPTYEVLPPSQLSNRLVLQDQTLSETNQDLPGDLSDDEDWQQFLAENFPELHTEAPLNDYSSVALEDEELIPYSNPTVIDVDSIVTREDSLPTATSTQQLASYASELRERTPEKSQLPLSSVSSSIQNIIDHLHFLPRINDETPKEKWDYLVYLTKVAALVNFQPDNPAEPRCSLPLATIFKIMVKDNVLSNLTLVDQQRKDLTYYKNKVNNILSYLKRRQQKGFCSDKKFMCDGQMLEIKEPGYSNEVKKLTTTEEKEDTLNRLQMHPRVKMFIETIKESQPQLAQAEVSTTATHANNAQKLGKRKQPASKQKTSAAKKQKTSNVDDSRTLANNLPFATPLVLDLFKQLPDPNVDANLFVYVIKLLELTYFMRLKANLPLQDKLSLTYVDIARIMYNHAHKNNPESKSTFATALCKVASLKNSYNNSNLIKFVDPDLITLKEEPVRDNQKLVPENNLQVVGPSHYSAQPVSLFGTSQSWTSQNTNLTYDKIPSL